MSCVTGNTHTITVSNDGVVHSFGENNYGQLGLGHRNNVSIPSRIPNLPKIKMVSCGYWFTVCVDYEGIMWSFGYNSEGSPLGTGNSNSYDQPQRVVDIPPVQTISCGYTHVLIITNDKNLWSVGNNGFGQLCLENQISHSKPQQTQFSNISKISTGRHHSLFQNNKGEIYGCGHNAHGQIGLGSYTSQVKVLLLPNLPSNIIDISCGFNHTLFLDMAGTIFSVGNNYYGQLGLGHKASQNTLNKIPNIPTIQTISCVGDSSYLIDVDNNLWSFGKNSKNVGSMKDIKQISYGSCGDHFLAKDSQNKIYVVESNSKGQLGTGDPEKFSNIWGDQNMENKLSAPNLTNYEATLIEYMKWKEEEIKKISALQFKINTIKSNLAKNNNSKMKQEFPQNSFETWTEVQCFLNEKYQQINAKVNQKLEKQTQLEKNQQVLETELNDIENNIQQLQLRKQNIEEILLPEAKKAKNTFIDNFQRFDNTQQILKEMCDDVSMFCQNENEMNAEIKELFEQKKSFDNFDCKDISKLLWKMDLVKYQQVFEEKNINGKLVELMIDDWSVWKKIGFEKRDYFYFSFCYEMMRNPGYSQIFSPDFEEDCVVCSHNTPEKTIHLVREYDIPIENEIILKNNFCSPMLLYPKLLNDLGIEVDIQSEKRKQIMCEVAKLKNHHMLHLKKLKQNKR